MSTKFVSAEEAQRERRWLLVDGNDQVVGRLASRIASILRGKENPKFSPHEDHGDFVIVVNAAQVRLSGRKLQRKIYRRHTGFVSGVVEESAVELLNRKPEEVLRRAVQGMLPKGPLGRRQLKKLKIYGGADHPHAAQQPEELSLRATVS